MNKKYDRINGIRRTKRNPKNLSSLGTQKQENINVTRKDSASELNKKINHSVQEGSLLYNSLDQKKNVRNNQGAKARLRKTSNYSRNSSFPWGAFFRIFIPVILGLVSAYVIISSFDSAIITIEPYQQTKNVDIQITAFRQAHSSQLEFSVIALSDSQEQELQADIDVELRERASGSIRIFNDYSSSPQKISAETRFEAVDGKIFRLAREDIIIPGKQGDTPGEVVAQVYAEKAGQDYNIDATDFSIPGFLEIGLNEKYEKIYALSTKPFTGGFIGTEPSISQERKQTSSEDLEQKLSEKLQRRIFAEKTPDMIVVENSLSLSLSEPVFIPSNTNSKGNLSISGTMYAILLNRQELARYLSQDQLDLQEGMTVQFDSESILRPIYIGEENIDYEQTSEIKLSLDNQLQFVWNLDQEDIKNHFSGISKDEIISSTKKIQSIGTINVRNHPRWKRILPSNPENIKIRIK